MISKIIFVFVVCVIVLGAEARDLLLTMPPVKPLKEDQYICHGLKLENDTLFITGFQPRANASHAHHILIHTCLEPGSTEQTWDCNEMATIKDPKRVCKSGYKLIYAWAMNAPGFKFPKDVSIIVGKSVGAPYLVLQNHYKDVDYFKIPDVSPDQSGFVVQTQSKPTKKLAGLYILGTDGSIPAHSTIFMESACTYTGKTPLHPFAFRIHTHKLGKLVSGYIIHNKQWIEIGRKSPQIEQLFYPIEKTLIIQRGDTLAARCVMENKGDKLVKIGSTQKDEMCNFYIYYWVPKAEINQIYDDFNEQCFTSGWPTFKWTNYIDSINIPDSAAMMPGENKIMKEMITDMKNTENKMDKLFSENFNNDFQDDLIDDSLSENSPKDFKLKNFQDADEFL